MLEVKCWNKRGRGINIRRSVISLFLFIITFTSISGQKINVLISINNYMITAQGIQKLIVKKKFIFKECKLLSEKKIGKKTAFIIEKW